MMREVLVPFEILGNIFKSIYKRIHIWHLLHYEEDVIYIFIPVIWLTLKRYHGGNLKSITIV